MDPNSPIPLYHQLKNEISEDIRTGRYQKNQAIPPERELIENYKVSRTTVRQALSELVMEGILWRQHGKGTFVAEIKPIAETLSTLTGHVEELTLRGWNPSINLLKLAVEKVSPDIAVALELDEDSEAFSVTRLISLDNTPLLLMEAWLPLGIGRQISEEALYRTSILRQLEALGIWPVRGVQRIKAASASEVESRHLGVPEGSAVLDVTRTIYSTRNDPIEWSRSVYNSERYEYIVDLRRR